MLCRCRCSRTAPYLHQDSEQHGLLPRYKPTSGHHRSQPGPRDQAQHQYWRLKGPRCVLTCKLILRVHWQSCVKPSSGDHSKSAIWHTHTHTTVDPLDTTYTTIKIYRTSLEMWTFEGLRSPSFARLRWETFMGNTDTKHHHSADPDTSLLEGQSFALARRHV